MHLEQEIDMPDSISWRQIGIWFCVGFFVSTGWTTAAVIVGRVLSRVL